VNSIRTAAATAGRLIRRYRAALYWVAFVVGVAILGYQYPHAQSGFLAVELAVVAAIWCTYFYVAAANARRAADRYRAARDREKQLSSALRELIHQHLLTVIKDDDAGPDAVARARELADASRAQLYASLEWTP
jgi:uncharacterized membrane protein